MKRIVTTAMPDVADRRTRPPDWVNDPAGHRTRRIQPTRASGFTGWFVRCLIRLLTASVLVALDVGRWLGRRPRAVGPDGYEILLTGTFDSRNWIAAHIRPLAMSSRCARVSLVSNVAIPSIPKVEVLMPPGWLLRVAGPVPARLIVFACMGAWRRPDYIGGFHLLVNAMVAALVGRWVGSRTLYFCVGGPPELLEGGIYGENRLFDCLRAADPVIEQRLLAIVRHFHLVVTMGTRAADFFRANGISTTVRVVAGGVDTTRFHAGTGPRDIDIVLVCRLVPVKRVDVFLHALHRVAAIRPHVRGVVIGDGPLRRELEELAGQLGLSANVAFAGRRDDVEQFLRRAKLVVLTSDSEGLALSIMEAMMCGTVPIVSRVGEFPDLVSDGRNGFLVGAGEADGFADRIASLLSDDALRAAMGSSAHQAALKHELASTARVWDTVLADADHRLARTAAQYAQ